ncbi:MAG: electron transport complex subunit RsxD [Gammaproteobacteria bacterium]|nr:electron transport complex subunit RsxD [Gammaproteobacteria bacterium]MBQ0840276.1 electron transport complex subunit RsxD [Gammaproteobacteria bacterium]
MALTRNSSPHAHGPRSTQWVMQQVLIATVPGLIVLTSFFGIGTIINILIASITAIGCEAAVLKLRQRPIGFYLRDYSALVTAVLLGLALPPLAPWWLAVTGTAFAIIIAKHLYGGMGFNPFNPAMIGYVVLLISFPLQMSAWLAPSGLVIDGTVAATPGLRDALQIVFAGNAIDGFTAATPLDAFKHNSGLLVENFYQQTPQFNQGRWAGFGWEWVNIAFLLGGCYLLGRKVFTWHAPVGMLGGLTLMALFNYDGGSSASNGSIIFHLLSGATMFGAFFIVTDPVTSATSNRGRLIYGALIGVILFLIRSWGNYPDALAFGVLLMNFAAPFIDYYTPPRTYGHGKSGTIIHRSKED